MVELESNSHMSICVFSIDCLRTDLFQLVSFWLAPQRGKAQPETTCAPGLPEHLYCQFVYAGSNSGQTNLRPSGAAAKHPGKSRSQVGISLGWWVISFQGNLSLPHTCVHLCNPVPRTAAVQRQSFARVTKGPLLWTECLHLPKIHVETLPPNGMVLEVGPLGSWLRFDEVKRVEPIWMRLVPF